MSLLKKVFWFYLLFAILINMAGDRVIQASDEKEMYMKEALQEAKKAQDIAEVPIGAVVVHNGKIIGRGYNKREKKQEAAAHAEMFAIAEANKKLGNWRLEECELYVTLEPCAMCSGALVLARMKKVYFGAYDSKSGTAGSLMNLLQEDRFNHQCEVEGAVLEKECSQILKNFFKELRKKKKS
jgi:tRNA(adenine34) deaminase